MRRIKRGIAILLSASGLHLVGEVPQVRVSAPALGWVLSPDGTQVIGITGVIESPRGGSVVGLPSAATRIWSSPDGERLLASAAEGLWLLAAGSRPRLVLESEAPSAAWTRNGAGFAACEREKCAAYAADGERRFNFSLPEGAALAAFESESKVAFRNADGLCVRINGSEVLIEGSQAVAFVPGTDEYWTIDAAGRLNGRGTRIDLLENAIGLVAAQDGSSLLAVDADGNAAKFDVRTGAIERFSLEAPVDGAWPAPGNFNVRLHDSAKKPIAFWSGDAAAFAWMPEVRQ